MSKLRRYKVGYWLEQGFVTTVEARSPAQAELIVRRMLRDDTHMQSDSKIVHYADGVCDVIRVKEGGQ